MDALDIRSLRARYLETELMPRALIEAVIGRIEAADPAIWISRFSNEALIARAEALAEQDPQALPLYGIPFAIKDNIDVSGLPTTAACEAFRYQPDANAFVVQQLIDAGAIAVGKTNLDQFATGLVGVRSPYGVPGNAFDPTVIPGGSSSGSAVAVALGLVSFSLGTDTAGSGRVPAALNNLIGLKPTRGVLSCRGVVPACRSLDCVSIFALNAPDASAVFKVAAAYDAADAYARPLELDRRSGATLRQPRCAVPLADNLRFFGDKRAEQAYRESLALWEAAGVKLVEADFGPLFDAAELLYGGPWVAERYIATRSLLERDPGALHPTTRAIIEGGRKPSAVDGFESAYRLAELTRASEALWAEFDFALTPTTGSIYTLAEVEADPVQLNSNLGYYTNFMNLLDLSACAVPGVFRSDGLPSGTTLIAPAQSDASLLFWADQVQRRLPFPMGAGQSMLAATGPALEPVTRGRTALLVCGAHMEGLALNAQLCERDGVKLADVRTAPCYKMFALDPMEGLPARPALVRVDPADGGVSLPAELWSLPTHELGGLLERIAAPLGLGRVMLEDGRSVCGFISEADAAKGTDITRFGGWRGYLQSIPSET